MIAVDGVDLASWWRCNWFSSRGFSSWRCWLLCCAWAINRARAAVGAIFVARADGGAFLHFRLALAHASWLVKTAVAHAIVRFVGAQVATDLLVVAVFLDAVWWRGWSGAVLIANLVVARAAVGAVRVAGTVVRALVEIVAVALVLAYARTIAIGDTLISDGNAVVDAFVSFVAPNNEALFDDGRIFGIAAPSWAGAAVGAFLVAGASVHASVLVRSAD